MKEKEIDVTKPGVDREFQSIPEADALTFFQNLRMVAQGLAPRLDITHLGSTVGSGAIELKINGSPAYRCIYTNKDPNKVTVLHVFKKTTNGPATKAYKVAKGRMS